MATPSKPALLAAPPTPASERWQVVRRLLKNPSGGLGAALIALFLVVAVCGALGLTPYPPDKPAPRDRLQAPTPAHLLGTDLFGRDVASRLMQGAGNSLYVAVSAVTFATLLGTLIGVLAGFVDGLTDIVTMRVMDVFFAFPALLLALVIVSILGTGINNAIIAIAIVYTPIFARVARGPVLSLKEMEFVLAARCVGMADHRVLLRHILPNMIAPLIVQVSLALSWALLTEASLSFLGLGTQPPQASWGVMLSEGRTIAERAPWLIFFPGVAIVLGVLGFNLLGDGLRDTLDPRLRGRG